MTDGNGQVNTMQEEKYFYIHNMKLAYCSQQTNEMARGSHPEKKAGYFWTLSKKGGGVVEPKSNSFVNFLGGLSFGH